VQKLSRLRLSAKTKCKNEASRAPNAARAREMSFSRAWRGMRSFGGVLWNFLRFS